MVTGSSFGSWYKHDLVSGRFTAPYSTLTGLMDWNLMKYNSVKVLTELFEGQRCRFHSRLGVVVIALVRDRSVVTINTM